MKKRVLSALLVLCMACSMVSTVWAEGTNATSGAPEPASQTLNLDNEQSGDESGADGTGAPGDSTDNTSASSDSTSSGSSSAASDATSGAVSDATSGEGDEGAASSDSTAASDSTSSSSSASSDSSDSDADDPDAAGSDVTGDESGTGAGEESGPVDEQPGASSESVPSQPNRAPAAAAPALQAETRATANEFKVYWQETWEGAWWQPETGQEYVTVQLYNTDGGRITGNVADITLYDKENVDFTAANANNVIPDIPGYRYTGAEYRRSSEGNWNTLISLKTTHSNVYGSNKWCYFINGDDNRHRETIDGDNLIVRLNYEETGLGIVDSVNTDGKFTARFTDPSITEGAEVTYTWYRCTTNSEDPQDWTEIEKTKIAGDLYNMEADNGTANATSVNVSLDSDEKAADTADNQKYWYKVVATVTKDGVTKPYEATRQVSYFVALQNGSFEIPERNGYGGEDTGVYTDVPGFEWKTTAEHDYIELIKVEPKDFYHQMQSATYENWGLWETADGLKQVAELNANEPSTLYQDVLTIPGTKLNWSLAHRARSHWNQGNITGSDTMYVVIMPVSQAQNLKTQDQVDRLIQEAEAAGNIVDNEENVVQLSDGTTACIWKLTDQATHNQFGYDTTTWNYHGGTYVVGNNEYATRFFFSAGKTATGGAGNTVGNLLDDVSFGKDVPRPNEDEVTIKGTKTVVGLDTLPQSYKVTVTVSDSTGTLGTQELTRDQFQEDDNGNWVADYAIQHVKIPADAQNYAITVSENVSGQPDSSEYTEEAQVSYENTTEQDGNMDIQVSGGDVYTVNFTNTYTPTIPKTATLTLEKTFVGLTDEDVYFLLFNQTKSGDLKDRREANFSFDVNFCDTKEDSFTEGSGWMENLQKQDNNDSPYQNETYYRPGTEEKITNGGEFIVYSVDCLKDVGLDAFKEEGYYQDTRVNGIGAYLRKENGNWVYTQTLTVPTCTDSGNRYFYTVFEQHAELPGYSKLDTSSVSYTVSLNNGEKTWNGIGKFICDEGKSIVSMDGITEQECIYGKTEEGDVITPFARLYITGDTTIEFENNYLDSMEVTKNVTLDGTAITSANEELNKEYTITLSPADTTKLVSTSSNSNKKGQGPDWNTKMTGYTVTATYSGGLQQHNETTLTFNNDGTLNIPLYPDETVTLGNLPSISYQLTESETVTADTNSYYFDGKSFAETYNDDKVSSDAAQWNSYSTGEDVGKSDIQDGKVALDVSLTDHDESVAVTLTNQYKTYKQLTIKKVTTGAMGADDDWFDFEVTGENNAEYILTDNQKPTNSDYHFKLNNGSTVVLTKLKDGDVVTIRENGAVNGYTFQGADAEATSEGGFELTPKNGDGDSGDYTVNSANNTVTVIIPDNAEADLGIMTFTNARQAVAPTGLESNHTTPYVLMITAAGMAGLALIGGIVARRIRRRRQE